MSKEGHIMHLDVEILLSEKHRKENSSMGEPKVELHKSHELYAFGPNFQFAHQDYSRISNDSTKIKL